MDYSITQSPPYGPTANLKTIFDTWRDRSMPEQLAKEWLERIGISPNLAAKNLHALRYLGLIDELGYTTEVAQRLRTATSEEYPLVLEEIVRKAYRKVFEIRDPSVDSRTRIDDAFRHEHPQAQRSRMVAAFLGLCSLAGIPLKEAPPSRESPVRRIAPVRKVRVDTPQVDALRPDTGAQKTSRPTSSDYSQALAPQSLNQVLAGLLKSIPDISSEEELDEWYAVFRSAFVFVKNMAAKQKSVSED